MRRNPPALEVPAIIASKSRGGGPFFAGTYPRLDRSTDKENTSGGSFEVDFVDSASEKEAKKGTVRFSFALANAMTVLLIIKETALASGLFPRPMPISMLIPVSSDLLPFVATPLCRRLLTASVICLSVGIVCERFVDKSVIAVTTTRVVPTSIRTATSRRSGLVTAVKVNSAGLKNSDAFVLLDTGRTRTKNLIYASFSSKGKGDEEREGVEEKEEEGDAPIVKLGVIDADLDNDAVDVFEFDGVIVAVRVVVVDGDAPFDKLGVGDEDGVKEDVAVREEDLETDKLELEDIVGAAVAVLIDEGGGEPPRETVFIDTDGVLPDIDDKLN